jgi:DNA-binding XRE family transcriptional regulator
LTNYRNHIDYPRQEKIIGSRGKLLNLLMQANKYVGERQLASLARKYRIRAGRNRAEAARELGVARQAIIYAEDQPKKSFTKLRRRLLEAYSPFRVRGPIFCLETKK